jgi:hypothetical protein
MLQHATTQVIIPNVMLLIVGRECRLDKVTPNFWRFSRHLTTIVPLYCVSIVYPASVLAGSFKGNDVSVSAQIATRSYGMVIGIIIFFSLTFPGAVLSSALLPENKIRHFGVT